MWFKLLFCDKNEVHQGTTRSPPIIPPPQPAVEIQTHFKLLILFSVYRWADLACEIAIRAVKTVTNDDVEGAREIDTKRYAKIEKIPGTPSCLCLKIVQSQNLW